MFGIGGFELFIILLFGFLIFGPDKLPEIARTVGAAIGKFKKAQDEMNQVINGEVLNPNVRPSGKGATRSSGRAQEDKETGDKPTPVVKETFAERKARFERERAQELEKAEVEANRAQVKAEAQARVETTASASTTSTTTPAAAAPAATAPAAKPKPQSQPLTAEELYGVKPKKPAKPASQSDPAVETNAAETKSAPAAGEADATSGKEA